MSADELRARVRALMPRARQDLSRMVSFQSVYDPKEPPPEDCQRMVDFTVDAFGGAGAGDVEAYETSDGSRVVCGHVPGPPDAPTVLLYFHHDVQPARDGHAWLSPPWELTERDGRWYGRGAADCKGNGVVHLTALRALAGELPVNVTIVGEGSEELGDGGLESFVIENPDLLRADVILVCDAGNAAVGAPSLTTSLRGVVEVTVTVRGLSGPVHSGRFGGAAPDALAALIHMLGTLHDRRGNTTVRGLDNHQAWPGAPCVAEQFRADAGVLDGVDLLGDDVADMIWARPSVTVLGIDCPPVAGSVGAIQPTARARVSLRVPPGTDPIVAQDALIDHLCTVAPWHVQVDCERDFAGAPFTGSVDGPAFGAMTDAMRTVYGQDVTLQGDGGSIPLCNVFQETFPDAEIMLLGVEEPLCGIHGPNESVDPTEIENMALVEAQFLTDCARKLIRIE
jgi:acetylornithine deacetylase/succinyl-diaminopimelate desuccinylase-like protein